MRSLFSFSIACLGILMACTADNSTAPSPSPEAPQRRSGAGVWISRDQLAVRPTSGAAWTRLESQARQACPPASLDDQESSANVCVLAKALVSARTADAATRGDVISAIRSVTGQPGYNGRALSLGRELAAYVIAADLIDLQTADPALDQSFRATIRALLTAPTSGGPANLIDCHETRPNNWGTHCGASRAAVANYLGDAGQLDRVALVFKGWLGNRAAYAGFSFGDLAWQCNPAAPVAINPPGCSRDGHSLDGVLADDQRRAGGFTWPPPRENYVYEALQGAFVQAVILHQNGHDAFNWEQRALLRAFEWLQHQAHYPPQGDDLWLVPLVNHYYGTAYPVSGGGHPGKGMGWTEWTHAR
jgi:hypothetical protein